MVTRRNKIKKRKKLDIILNEVQEYKILLRNVPSLVMSLFVVSVILMNLLANKEVITPIPFLALDCGFTLSWLSFLSMDMLTKRFGAKAAFELSLTAMGVNLIVCGLFYIVSNISGNWGEFYTYGDPNINSALNATIGGTWFVLLGSVIAFIVSSGVNCFLNSYIGSKLRNVGFKDYAIRSYVSTMIGQFVDNMIFAIIVSHTFFGWNWIQVLTCSITGCIIELLCEVIFSPIGYRVCQQWEKENVGSGYIRK